MIIMAFPIAFLALIGIGIILLLGLLWSIGFWIILGLAIAAACFLGFPLVLVSGLIIAITCIPLPLMFLAVASFFFVRRIRG